MARVKYAGACIRVLFAFDIYKRAGELRGPRDIRKQRYSDIVIKTREKKRRTDNNVGYTFFIWTDGFPDLYYYYAKRAIIY